MPTNTVFYGVSRSDESLNSEQLECNLQSYFDWSFLNIGGFNDVVIPTSGIYGGNFERLRLSEDKNYTKGRVWESARQNWIWESGVEYQSQPISISGVYVNGNFQPSTGVGTYAHSIDYPRGRIIFDSAIASTSVVKCEYSYKYFNVMRASDTKLNQVQFDSFRVDSDNYLQYGSGDYSYTRDRMLQLPLIIVEATPSVKWSGYELGDGLKKLNQQIIFHIYAESRSDRNFIHDVILRQWNKTLVAYDVNAVNENLNFPLNYDGSLKDGAKTYPQLVEGSGTGGYAWRNYYMTDVNSSYHGVEGKLFYTMIRSYYQILV